MSASMDVLVYRLPIVRARRDFQKGHRTIMAEDGRMPPENMMQGLSAAFSHIDPEKVTNGQIYSLLYSMRAQQIQSNAELEALRIAFAASQVELKDLKKAWDTSQTLVKFIKFLGTVGLPVAGLLAILKAIAMKFHLWP